MKSKFKIKFMKKIILGVILFPLITFSQKTTVAITGLGVFKLGDDVSVIDTYGYDFTELKIDSEFDFSVKNYDIDSFKNFCPKARVYFTQSVKLDEFEFDEGLTLTYLDNKLIDIRLSEILNDDKIISIFKYKYGNAYGKIFLAGYQYNKTKMKAKGIVITPAIDKSLQNDFLSSIFWTYEGKTVSVGGSNKTYDFIERSYKSPNLAKGGISVTDDKKYSELISCSNLEYQLRLKKFNGSLKGKSSNF